MLELKPETLGKAEEGLGLCLSGGGNRALLFHLGALWRLNEFGYLPKLDRVASVSGGSIVAGWLGCIWDELAFDASGVATNFVEEVVEPLRAFASKKLDLWIALSGLFDPFQTIAQKLAWAYRKNLYGAFTLQDLPDRPRFIYTAANAQTGMLWRSSKPYMGDYRVGLIELPRLPLAEAIAASSGFPPFFSPVRFKLENRDYMPDSGEDLQKPPFTTDVRLMDGGAYDNLGLEPVIKRCKTVLVSDGGGRMQPDPKPPVFWPVQLMRVLSVIDSQVRALRRRQVVGLYVDGVREGAYWGAFSDIANYHLPDSLHCPYEKTLELAMWPTRLWAVLPEIQQRLINWGYAICDTAMRKHVDPGLTPPAGFPFAGGVG